MAEEERFPLWGEWAESYTRQLHEPPEGSSAAQSRGLSGPCRCRDPLSASRLTPGRAAKPKEDWKTPTVGIPRDVTLPHHPQCRLVKKPHSCTQLSISFGEPLLNIKVQTTVIRHPRKTHTGSLAQRPFHPPGCAFLTWKLVKIHLPESLAARILEEDEVL